MKRGSIRKGLIFGALLLLAAAVPWVLTQAYHRSRANQAERAIARSIGYNEDAYVALRAMSQKTNEQRLPLNDQEWDLLSTYLALEPPSFRQWVAGVLRDEALRGRRSKAISCLQTMLKDVNEEVAASALLHLWKARVEDREGMARQHTSDKRPKVSEMAKALIQTPPPEAK